LDKNLNVPKGCLTAGVFILLEKLHLEDPAAFEHKWYAVFLLL